MPDEKEGRAFTPQHEQIVALTRECIEKDAPSLLQYPTEAQHLTARIVSAILQMEERIIHAAKLRGPCFDWRHSGAIVVQPELRHMAVMTERCPHGNPNGPVLVVKDWWCPWKPGNYKESVGDLRALPLFWMGNLVKNYETLVGFAEWLVATNQRTSLGVLYSKERGGTGVHEDKPAYLVGSGPSLAKNAHELSKVKNGMVLAVNGAFPFVEKPDYFLTVDWLGKDEWFKGQADKVASTTALLMWGAAPLAVKRPWYESRFFGQMGQIPSDNWVRQVFPMLDDLDRGYTSMLAAFHFAVLCGCNPIVFVGCDYAFGEEKKEHVGAESPVEPKQNILLANDIYGQEVYTDGSLAIFLEHMKAASKFCAVHGTKVINATEGGIFALPSSDPLHGAIECIPLGRVVTMCNEGVHDGIPIRHASPGEVPGGGAESGPGPEAGLGPRGAGEDAEGGGCGVVSQVSGSVA